MIYQFFLDTVRYFAPEDALVEFKRLFFDYQSTPNNIDAFTSLSRILSENDRDEFINTLKRCCYILINNWETKRQSPAICQLVDSFADLNFTVRPTHKKNIRRLKSWLKFFLESQGYQELQLFISRHNTNSPQQHWSSRYTSYLLVPQYSNSSNSPEQREAARVLCKQLKDRFKFDLAMYTARSELEHQPPSPVDNPTALGTNVLRLIKKIVAKRGQFSHTNLAHIFIKQIKGIRYREFKTALLNYLIFSVEKQTIVEILKTNLSRKLEKLYVDRDDETVNEALILRTCNKIFGYLTTEGEKQPSETFVFLLSQGNPLTLVMVLLKLVLICPNSRTHLENRIADLIRYYQQFPNEDSQWVVNFFEIFNITFSIYADNDVQYNLIRVKSNKSNHSDEEDNLDAYRIFSQHKELYAPAIAEPEVNAIDEYLSS
ncbi:MULTISPECIES: hypothetical protein [Spirulina sp. CCY15215]|uniref:hypothetical protein n=1 Tax=Spirulina sp. CCY15215 TaxID=2767591 RepID=UPI0019505A23|nr:hypothetical protein [Spirulina major]